MGKNSKAAHALLKECGRTNDTPADQSTRRGECTYVLATVTDARSVVEMCATIAFLNERSASYRGDGRDAKTLKAHIVVSDRASGQWKPENTVVFKTSGSDRPCALKDKFHFSAPGSTYRVSIHDREPQIWPRLHCSFPGPVTEDEALERAILGSALLIDRPIDPSCFAFRDAVDSRLRAFERTQMQQLARCCPHRPSSAESSDIDSEASVNANVAPPPPPPPPRQTAAFDCPKSTRLNDLLHAFATHVVDHTTGDGVQLRPLQLPTECSTLRPLIFCPCMGTPVSFDGVSV